MSTKKMMTRRNYYENINRVKDSLLQWICEKHATNSPLDRDLLRQRAIDLANQFGVEDFKCSNMWLTIFLKKYGFSTTLTNCCGPTFTDYRKWVDLLRSLITQYRYKDLFHVDEMIMYVNMSPRRLPANVDTLKGLNKSDKMAVLMCCNSSGTEKMSLLISGGWKGSIKKEDYCYKYNENSSISMESFGDWLSELNDKMILTKRKILLLMQRSRIHILKDLQLSNVNLIFFPRNFPTNLRPLRRDIFHCVKMIYRRNYVGRFGINDHSKLTVDDVLENIVDSWKSVPKDLIVSSFQRTSFRSDDRCLNINYEGWNKLDLGITFKRFVTFDDSLSDDPTDFFGTPRSGCSSYVPRRSYEETVDLDYPDEKSDSNLDKDCNDENTLSASTSKDGTISDMENCSSVREKEEERNLSKNMYLHKSTNSFEIAPGLFDNPINLEVIVNNVEINDLQGQPMDSVSKNSKDIPHNSECPEIGEDRPSSKRKQIGPCWNDKVTDVEEPIDKRAKTDDSCSQSCERTFVVAPIILDTIANPTLAKMDEASVIERVAKHSTSSNMDPEGGKYIVTISDNARSPSSSSEN